MQLREIDATHEDDSVIPTLFMKPIFRVNVL